MSWAGLVMIDRAMRTLEAVRWARSGSLINSLVGVEGDLPTASGVNLRRMARLYGVVRHPDDEQDPR